MCGCGCVGLLDQMAAVMLMVNNSQHRRWNRRQDQLRTVGRHPFPLTWLCLVQNQHNNYNTTTTDNNNKMLDDMNSLWVHILEYSSMFLLNKGTHQLKVWTRAGRNRPILVHVQRHFLISHCRPCCDLGITYYRLRKQLRTGKSLRTILLV